MRARGAVERDPKDEPRSGEDKGRVTRGLGVMGLVMEAPSEAPVVG